MIFFTLPVLSNDVYFADRSKCNRNESSNRNNMKLRLHLIILIIPLTLAISQEVTGDSPAGTVVEID